MELRDMDRTKKIGLLDGTWIEQKRLGSKLLQTDEITLIAYTMWQGWTSRCKKIFQGVRCDPKVLAEHTVNMSREFMQREVSIEEMDRRQNWQWRLANANHILYTDGAWDEGQTTAGIGFIILQTDGRFCHAGAGRRDANSALDGELQAMEEGLRTLAQLRTKGAIILTDNQSITRFLNEEIRDQDWRTREKIRECERLLKEIKHWSVLKIGRERNDIADQLAREAKHNGRELKLDDIETVPEWLRNKISSVNFGADYFV